MGDLFDNLPALHAVRRAVIASPEVAGADVLSVPGGHGSDGTFRLTLADGTMVRADLTVIGLRAGSGEAPGEPAGTVMDLRTQEPRTVTRDGGCLVIPAVRLDAAGCELLRKILVGEALDLAAEPEPYTGHLRFPAIPAGPDDPHRLRAEAEDDAGVTPFGNGMHFIESLCPSSLPLAGRSPVPCHLELHHRGPHGSLGEPLQWVGAGGAARVIEAHRSPVITERRMREALGYDRQAHRAWYDQKCPLRIDWPAEPHNEAATLAAIAEYTSGQVTP